MYESSNDQRRRIPSARRDSDAHALSHCLADLLISDAAILLDPAAAEWLGRSKETAIGESGASKGNASFYTSETCDDRE